ncbi:venom carboxylesterase-6-like [Arctopsyche grandis]|uniref:venom carboxylesterase-6-like n=1 Tax=Arctopsyche grandis TaxID=121162 RepID=UPI00406D6B43
MTKTKFFIYCVCAILHFCSGDAPEVRTSQGSLRGAYFNTIKGRKYAAFMSVPFAQPPIGSLRFKATIEAGTWEGVRDATQDSPHCIQSNPYMRSDEISGDEDCLYLNVYTPAEVKDGTPLPVMVFFHGGGWVTGSGNKFHYGPDRLLDRDVVLVGVNYRLGALGFLSTMDEAAPGNWLFKDQNMALRWIKKHIVHFGGDPNLVTIFGESAGAASVHYHMLSPMSQGLFHRAILHSGSALCDWANSSPGHPQKQAKKLGKIMECPIDDNLKMIECLRTKEAKEIIAADKFFYEWDFDPMIPFRPVVEPLNEHSFLSEDPRVLFKEGRFAQVPMMNGLNENEGAIRTSPLLGVPGLLDEFVENFDDLAPVSFMYQHSKDADAITEAIKEFYLKGITISSDTYLNLTDIYSDTYFTAGVDEALNLMLPKASKSIYLYFFTFKGRHSFSEVFGDSTRNYGACHVDELMYLFNIGMFPELEGREKDVSDAVLSIWTNFAKTGDPSSPVRETKLGNIPSWPKLDTSDKWKHVQIGEKLEKQDDLFKIRRHFWRNLPLWPKHHSAIYVKSEKTEL